MSAGGSPFRPTAFGRYEVLSELSSGGQGIVYLARQPGTRRLVALKRFLPGEQASTRELAEREVQAAARLDHPGIVTLYGLDEIEGELFLVMEFVDGVPITRFAAERSLDARAVLGLLLLVCDAVQHAHQRGVLHRDLKPDNILVDGAGQPRVLDFGLARCTTEVAWPPPSGGVGTLHYAAPERLRGETGDVRADVYALGVIGYEMLTGRRPHGDADGVAGVVQAILTEKPQSLEARDRRLGRDLDLVLGKALAKDPHSRYATVDAFAEDVRRYLAGAPLLAHRESATYQMLKLWQRHRTQIACAAALLALIVMLAGATLLQALRIQRQHREVLAAERTEHEARIAAERESERALAADRRARESLALATQAQRDAETEAESLEQVLSFSYLNGIARILSGAEDASRPRRPAPPR